MIGINITLGLSLLINVFLLAMVLMNDCRILKLQNQILKLVDIIKDKKTPGIKKLKKGGF